MSAALDRFAVNLEMWWPDLSRIDRVRAAADAGFGLAEIWYWPNWDISTLARVTQDHGIGITQIGGWDFEPRLHEDHAGFRDGIAAAIEAAVTLDAPLININGPYLRPGEAGSDVVSGVIEALASVVDLAEAADVSLMVEPMNLRVDHPGYSLPTSRDVIEVCRSVGSEALGINWDLYHLQISEGDLTGHLTEGIDHVKYVQVADHPGRHEPGTGEIQYRYVLEQLAELGYDGPIGLECSPADDAEHAIAAIEELAAEIAGKRQLG